MCNAFNTARKPEQLRQAPDPEVIHLIRRTDPAPVLLASGEFVTMRWGFQRSGLGPVNNTRSDRLDRPMWREAMAKRRCLIPLLSFYEWTGPRGRKQTHLFHHPDQKWLHAAGIWEESDEFGPCFSMLTTDANAVVAPIHHRMPALLTEAEQETYLTEGLATFKPPPDLLTTRPTANPLVQKRPTHIQEDLF